jgi:glycosyltransferase XagB
MHNKRQKNKLFYSTQEINQKHQSSSWSDFFLPFSLGLFLAVITFYAITHTGNFITLFITVLISAMTTQGMFFVYLMLYAWEDPEQIERNKESKKNLAPQKSFSALIPAKNEEKVIADTIKTIAAIDYPEDKKEIIIVCRNDDQKTIAKAQQAIYELNKPNIKLIRYEDTPVNKPHALNIGLQFATKDIIVIFDAEDEPHPDIYTIINSIFLTENPDVIQAGVQLMNIDSPWFAAFNVLEYFFWFKSGLHFFAKIGCLPLGGNSTFFKKSIIKKVGGWDEKCLTEDADIGIRLSKIGAKFRLVYDERYVTQEETPPSVDSFIKQRSRWNQGFLQVFAKGDWSSVQGIVRKLCAIYILTLPEFQAFSLIYTPLAFFMIWKFKLDIALALSSFIPMYLLILQLIIYNVGLYEFCRDYKIKYSFGYAFKLFLLFFPYQIMLGISAFRALLRFIVGKENWEKTVHLNIHRDFALDNIAA